MSDLTDFVARTELRRIEALRTLDATEQAKLGQFFTPRAASELIASIPSLPSSGSIKILDPGAGAGSLVAALVARILAEKPGLSIDVVAQELDSGVAHHLEATLTDMEQTAKALGVTINTTLVGGDYIADAELLGNGFDIVVMNPPYAKVAAASKHRELMAARGVLTPNLYAAFMALGIRNLKHGGQLVAITPRSFTNGTYFSQFRSDLLDRVSLDRIHIFASRSTVFSDTGVLQENIILSATLGGDSREVIISTSTGHNDEVVERTVPSAEIVQPDDKNRYIRIPSGEGDKEVVDLMAMLPATLADLGVKVSTGRVVDFRSRENLMAEPTGEVYPIAYPSNFKQGIVVHPLVGGKPQWFRTLEAKEEKMLVPAGTYVLVKRFSAKEERRRLVAGIWSDELHGDVKVAFDNKTNFLHIDGSGMDRDLAIGLSLWLNSTVVDNYFRTFSGHTQVNAGDLRSMRFPGLDSLRGLGSGRSFTLPEQTEVDGLITHMVSKQTAVAA
jgi:adenine-specific DNA-methyltransferase